MMKKIYLTLLLTLGTSLLILAQSTNSINIETVIQSGHSRPICALAISPDGKYIATGSFDNTIKLWNTKTGKEIRTFTENTGRIMSLVFHADGKKILSSSGDNRVVEYNILTGEAVTKIRQEKDNLLRACYSPDGTKILSMTNRNIVSLWNTGSGKLINTYEKNYSAYINPQWFTPDGTKLMTTEDYKDAKLIDINTGDIAQTFTFDKAYSFAISPNGKNVAIGSDKLFSKVFDIESGKELFELRINDDRCDGCKTHVTYSHNGKYLLSGSRKTGLVLWNAANGKRIKHFALEKEYLGKVKFSPNDKYIIVTYDDNSWIWDVATGKQILKVQNDEIDCEPVISPDGKNILTWSENNTATLKRMSDQRILKRYKGFRNKTRDDGMAFKQGNWLHTNILRYIHMKPATALSPDGKFLVKGKIDSSVVVLDLETGKKVMTLKGHSRVVLTACFSHDGKILATAGGDRKIITWDIKTGKKLNVYPVHQDLIFDLKFSANDKHILSGSWDGTLRVSDVNSGELIKYIVLEKVSPYKVAYSPKDLYYITSDLGKNLKLWEADAGKEFRQIIGHTNLVVDMQLSINGKQLITASLDGTVKVWDLLTGMLVNKFTQHTSGVYSIAIDPLERYYASGSNDRTIRIWDKDTGKEVKILTGHSGAVSGLYFTPDGNRLISCSTEGVLKVWDLNTFQEVYTYIQLDREDWLIKNPSGYFDGSKRALSAINYVSGLDVIPVGSLFEKYYTPNLWRRVNEGEIFSQTGANINSTLSGAPEVQLKVELSEQDKVDIKAGGDSIEWFTNTIPLNIELTDKGLGIDEYRVYNNGKLIYDEAMANGKARAGKQVSKSVEIPIRTGDNKITVVALNKDRTESEPVSINVFHDGVESQSDLYILSVGIDKYSNPNYELSYAVNDAKSYTRRIRKGAKTIFRNVEYIQVENSDANKSAIQDAFVQIAAKAKPEDVFIFYFAGHGAMSSGAEKSFYIIPYDVTQMYGADEQLMEKAISAPDLLEFSKQIAAGKQMFILDACQSGGALEAINTRGANREKAIAQLARSTGTFFLLASGAVQFASEARELGHGIFTYALIEGIDGKADGGDLDRKITANELKGYVEDRVPEITSEYMLTPQYPTGYGFGQDFPIVLVK